MIGSALFNQAEAVRDLRDPAVARQSVQYLLSQQQRELLQGMGRYSRHNDPEAAAIVGRVQDFTIGPDGPTAKWNTGVDRFDKDAEEQWGAYFHGIGPNAIDCRRLHAGPYLLRQVIQGWMDAGRSAAIICGTLDGAITAATGGMQMIDGLRIKNDLGRMDDDTMVAGVELDDFGSPIAIRVADWERAGGYLSHRTRRVSTGFLYLPSPLSADFDTIAPAPGLAPILPSLAWKQQSMQASVLAFLTQAALPAYVKRAPTGVSLANEAADNTADNGDGAVGLRQDGSGGTEFAAARPGIDYLEAGEDIVFQQSHFPSEALPTFLKQVDSRIASPLGYTRSTMSGEWEAGGFTQARLELQFVGQRTKVMQRSVETEFLLPVIRRAFVPSRILMGALPANLPAGWDKPEITHTGMPEADPSKTAVRHLTELRGMGRTLQMQADELGVSRDDLVEAIARDAADLRAAGIQHPAAAVVQVPGDGVGAQHERAGGDDAGGGADGEGTDDQQNTGDAGGGAQALE